MSNCPLCDSKCTKLQIQKSIHHKGVEYSTTVEIFHCLLCHIDFHSGSTKSEWNRKFRELVDSIPNYIHPSDVYLFREINEFSVKMAASMFCVSEEIFKKWETGEEHPDEESTILLKEYLRENL